MPRYEIEHYCPLTESQKDELAEAVTRIHATAFSTPRFFVNIRFTDIAKHDVYVAGKRRQSNRIFAYVRNGPSRAKAEFESVAEQIIAEWDRIVPLPHVSRSTPKPDRTLRMVMFFGCIVAGYEAGFMTPDAGGDKQWLKDNVAAFQWRADEGDKDFKEMIAECKQRGLIE
ncbi:hypothetical protein C1H76_8041 [Elsinoe australis]|uniref:Tautomerase cis-CaaD-like domain-containing protein n=1 Tax=Elsinoe australis TaxID=40998 RepID=A0A2P8AFM5_9PEZI|nr:hypothetical protein B9Z65_3575 [Elsinoe australis]TKX19843.1 hypothetical protein C1H76_8041 [Elsinoe australis]